MRRHAICFTGQERGFVEIGRALRDAVANFHGNESATYFGVRPTNDSWSAMKELIPFSHIWDQEHCYSQEEIEVTVSWLHCDLTGRTSDCRVGFLQMLCDMQRCEAMIEAEERQTGSPFDSILWLRTDVFWETRYRIPSKLENNTVYLPAMEQQSGVNDHMAFGERHAMRLYLRRLQHAHRAYNMTNELGIGALKGKGTEFFLKAALRFEGVRVTKVPQWAYCTHNMRAIQGRSNLLGCIGRVRCRTRCPSLVCRIAGSNVGTCDCINVTCAELAEHHNGVRSIVPGMLMHNRSGSSYFSVFVRSTPHKGLPCVDADSIGMQVFHDCPQRKSTPAPRSIIPGVTAVTACGDVCRSVDRHYNFFGDGHGWYPIR